MKRVNEANIYFRKGHKFQENVQVQKGMIILYDCRYATFHEWCNKRDITCKTLKLFVVEPFTFLTSAPANRFQFDANDNLLLRRQNVNGFRVTRTKLLTGPAENLCKANIIKK